MQAFKHLDACSQGNHNIGHRPCSVAELSFEGEFLHLTFLHRVALNCGPSRHALAQGTTLLAHAAPILATSGQVSANIYYDIYNILDTLAWQTKPPWHACSA